MYHDRFIPLTTIGLRCNLISRFIFWGVYPFLGNSSLTVSSKLNPNPRANVRNDNYTIIKIQHIYSKFVFKANSEFEKFYINTWKIMMKVVNNLIDIRYCITFVLKWYSCWKQWIKIKSLSVGRTTENLWSLLEYQVVKIKKISLM